jgi:hypothetical protein
MPELSFNTKKIPHAAIVRAPGLLPMLYTLGELEEELGISPSTLRTWMDKGAPHQHDKRGHIWVNGRELADWVETTRKSRQSYQLADGEAYCFHCRRPVKPLDFQSQPRGKRILRSGTCPECGCKINRWGRNGKS